MRTLITNGTIVTADGSTAADVLIDGETIAAIGADLGGDGHRPPTRRSTPRGKYVIPGAIDVHTHMELPFGGTFAKDTFETGTRAAAFGGTTTIVDFAVQSRGKSLREGLDAWHAKAEGNAVADYGFHMIMSDVNDDTLAEMDQLVAEGVPDFKLFTAYPGVFYSDDGAIFRAMQQTGEERRADHDARRERDGDRRRRGRPVAAGKTDPLLPRRRPLPDLRGRGDEPGDPPGRGGPGARSTSSTSRRATRSNAVRDARDRGSQAFAETCPQYLFLSLDDMGNGFEGAKFVCSPPLRPADHQDELWTGLDQGRPPGRRRPTTARSTSTARRSWARATSGRSRTACRASRTGSTCSTTAASSAAGSRSERWVEIISTAPAKLFGMYPRKGAVAVGADADLVVYDPNGKRTRSPPRPTTWTSTTRATRAARSRAARTSSCRAARSIVRDGEFTGQEGPRPVRQARAGRLRPDGLERRPQRARRSGPRPAARPRSDAKSDGSRPPRRARTTNSTMHAPITEMTMLPSSGPVTSPTPMSEAR